MKMYWGIIIGVCLMVIGTGMRGAAEEEATLEMWSHWGADAVKVRFVEETVLAFEALHPNITINLHWIDKNRIEQSLQASLPKGQGPDICYSQPYPFQANVWVLGGYFLDLKEKLDWSRFEPSAYKLLWEYPDGGIYAVPIELAEYAVYYHKGVFARAGISIPESGKFTAEEFLEVVKRLRSQGIIPLAVGNQDRGTFSNTLLQGLLLRFGGVQKIRSLMTGEISWTDPDIAAAFTYMKQLIDAGVFPENMNLLKFEEGRDLFVQGKAAMNVEGTWFFGKIADPQGNLPPELREHLGAMDFPIVTDGKGNEAIERITGGSYAIRKGSPHTDEAVKFLDFMTTAENGLKWVQYTQSPFGVKVGFAEQVSYPFLQELFRSRGDVKEVLVPGVVSLLRPEEYKVWVRDVGITFMGGNMSVAEVLRRLSEAAAME